MEVKKISDYKNIDVIGLGKELLERVFKFQLSPYPDDEVSSAKFVRIDRNKRYEIIIDIKWDRLKEDMALDIVNQILYLYENHKPKTIILLNFQFYDEGAIQAVNNELKNRKLINVFELQILDIQWINKQLDAFPDIREKWFTNGEIDANALNRIKEISNSGRNLFAAGHNWDEGNQLDRFLKEGIWENGHKEKLTGVVNQAKAGDIILLKSTVRKGKRGDLRIKAIGIITGNARNGRNLSVNWEQIREIDLPGLGGTRYAINKIGTENVVRVLEELYKQLPELFDIIDNLSITDSHDSKQISAEDELKYTYSDISINSESDKSFLKVEEVAKIFANIIIGSTNKTTSTSQEDRFYGLFGKWGRGKTFMWKKLKAIFDQKKYKTVEFHAWKYQNTPAIWGYLYETIASNYYLKPKYVILTPFTTIVNGILSLWLSIYRSFNQFLFFIIGIIGIYLGFLAGKHISLKITSFDDIITFIIPPALLTLYTGLNIFSKPIVSKTKTYIKTFGKKVDYSKHLGLQHEIQCELKHLLKAWNKSIVLFIDDIDRCNDEKIIDIVDSIRIMLNDPDIQKRLIVIAAIDHSILKSAIRKKYENKVESDSLEFRIIEYFDKLFLVGLKLEELDSLQIQEIFLGITDPYIEETEINEFNNEPNEMKIETEEVVDKLPESSSKQDVSAPVTDFNSVGQNNNLNEEPNENTEEPNVVSEVKVNLVETQITPDEQVFLMELITKLNRATPRSIRNFFIKYRIARNLTYFLRYENDSDDSEWVKNDNAKKIIAKILVNIMNLEDRYHEDLDTLTPELKSAMIRSINMVNYYD